MAKGRTDTLRQVFLVGATTAYHLPFGLLRIPFSVDLLKAIIFRLLDGGTAFSMRPLSLLLRFSVDRLVYFLIMISLVFSAEQSVVIFFDQLVYFLMISLVFSADQSVVIFC